MRILFVQETNWVNRKPIDQHNLAERLSLRGHKLLIIDFEIDWNKHPYDGILSPRKVFNNVTKTVSNASVTVVHPKILRVPILDYLSLAFSQWTEINRQVSEFNPDLIIGLGGIFSCIGGVVAKRKSIPFITFWVDIHHRLVSLYPLQVIGWIIEHFSVKLSDKIVVVNENIMAYVLNIGASKDDIRLLSTGVDLQKFNPSINGSKIRNLYHIKREQIVLLFVGWLYHFSGLKEVMKKLAIYDGADLVLLIVGDGDAYEDLVKIKQELNLNDHVILVGAKPYSEIPSFIAASDICILPAYPDELIMRDIVPIKLYEYMAMKKPVVVTKLYGTMRRFGNDHGIQYVDQPEDVIQNSVDIIKSGRAEELGFKARRFVEQCDWNYLTGEFEKILTAVTETK